MTGTKTRKRVIALILGGCLFITPIVIAKNLLYTPDGRIVHIKGGALQPDLSMYRSPLDSKVVDRRFYTNDATFMANEGFKIGMEGYNDFAKAGVPVAYRRGFQWITSKEIYFYARYLLDYTGGRGHAGVHMVHAPYWTMQALRHSSYNKIQRDRGERTFSNKDIMLGLYLPMVYQRTGFPRVFDDIQVSYVQYKSVDPHFTGKLDNTDSFEDPMSDKKGGWGQPNVYMNDYTQRFDPDKMNTTFDLGAIGQFVKRRMQWSDYFFHSEHNEVSPVSLGTEVSMLGNDAEEGMRGWGLTMAATNTILEVKSSMFTDGKKLMGINPAEYDPAQGLRYIPHEIEPNILWVGDIPERLWSMSLKDKSSQLWDQASWIWGSSTYAMTAMRRPMVFTDNPPVDGGFIEKEMGLVAESLTNAVFKNIEAMHLKDGILVSEWTPKNGTGAQITMRDMTMAIVALYDMAQTWELLEKYSKTSRRAQKIVERNGRFLLEVQNTDGSFNESYTVDGQSIGDNNLSAPNWAGIRALLAAYYLTEDEDFLAAARKTFNLLNSEYWVEEFGVYRTQLGDDTVVVEPYGVGIALAAMREMIFATPAHRTDAQIERFSRWWVQTVDQSGSMQSESERTGEIYTGFIREDDDGDGIAYTSKGDGSNGIAPLLAGKVVINVGGADNREFAKMKGEHYDANRYGTVRMKYRQKSTEEQAAILTPLIFDEAGLVEREPMEREDGTIIPLQPSKPIKVGYGTVLGLSGQQMFEANCAGCHGQFGEGIDGLSLEADIDRTHQAMFKIVNTGRFDKFMPPWGVGNGDGFGGPLTRDEIDKIVDYVQSDGFRQNHQRAENGEVIPGSLPRDVWFYLSRENAKAGGTLISNASDARRIYDQSVDPATIEAPLTENIRRIIPDGELTLEDRDMLRRKLGFSEDGLSRTAEADK